MIRPLSLLLLSGATLTVGFPAAEKNIASSCRYALKYSQKQLMSNPDGFINDMLYWEGHFHQNGVGYNTANGMTYDGTQIDLNTGLAAPGLRHNFSASSKEVCNS
jgi:hypothetical protein